MPFRAGDAASTGATGMESSASAEIAAKEIIWKSERLKIAVYGFSPLATTRRTPAGGAARWRILGRKYAGLASAGVADQRAQLPPAVYVLIDVIDMEHRAHELPCNADFWLAVQQELLPLLKNACRLATAPTVPVAGQSLAVFSLYAALHRPQRFGCVLSQSGSTRPHPRRPAGRAVNRTT